MASIIVLHLSTLNIISSTKSLLSMYMFICIYQCNIYPNSCPSHWRKLICSHPNSFKCMFLYLTVSHWESPPPLPHNLISVNNSEKELLLIAYKIFCIYSITAFAQNLHLPEIWFYSELMMMRLKCAGITMMLVIESQLVWLEWSLYAVFFCFILLVQ